MQALSANARVLVQHPSREALQRILLSQSEGYLDCEFCRGGPVGCLKVLCARRKVIKAVLLLQQMPVLPPLVAILAATPAKAEPAESPGNAPPQHSYDSALSWKPGIVVSFAHSFIVFACAEQAVLLPAVPLTSHACQPGPCSCRVGASDKVLHALSQISCVQKGSPDARNGVHSSIGQNKGHPADAESGLSNYAISCIQNACQLPGWPMVISAQQIRNTEPDQ